MRSLIICLLFSFLAAAFCRAETPAPSARTNAITIHTLGANRFMAEIRTGQRPIAQTPALPSARTTDTVSNLSIRRTRSAIAAFPDSVDGGDFLCRYDGGNPLRGLEFESYGYRVTYTPAYDWTGVTSSLAFSADGVKESVIFTEEAVRTVAWTVETDAVVHEDNGALVFSDDRGSFLFMTPAPFAVDALLAATPVTTTFEDGCLICTIEPAAGTVWPVVLDPSIQMGPSRNGTSYVYPTETSWQAARDRSPGTDMVTGELQVGPWYTGLYYGNYRSFLSFPVTLSSNAVVDSMALCLDGVMKIGGPFTVYGVLGTQSGAMGTEEYTQFSGRRAAQSHLVEYLTEGWSSTSYSDGWNRIRFTANGINRFKSAIGDTLRICLINKENDIDNTAWTASASVRFESSSRWYGGSAPYLAVYYHYIIMPPEHFAMTALDSTTIACSWDDMSDNEQRFLLLDMATGAVLDSLAANAEADTLRGFAINERLRWRVAADSSGVRSYSDPDSAFTLIPPPLARTCRIMPTASDTLRITVSPPANNPFSGATGLEVDALSGWGATDSGALTGLYDYRDGGLDPDSTAVYRARYLNGDGIPGSWSDAFVYAMKGRASLNLPLSDDYSDDYSVFSGGGVRDSTVVRAGRRADGAKMDGFFSFEIPWELHKGGADSLFLTLTRTGENAATTPTLALRLIGNADCDPVENLSLAGQDSTGATISWTISSGAGEKRSPNLRPLFRLWQDLAARRDYDAGFGLRLDDNNASAGSYAVFYDAANPLWTGSMTRLTAFFTPGAPDTLRGAPSGLALEAFAPDSLAAVWEQGAEGAYGYRLVDAVDSSAVAAADTIAAGVTALTVGGLIPDSLHRWILKAFTRFDNSFSDAAETRTFMRTPGKTTVRTVSPSSVAFVIDPADNPVWTTFAVADSLSGRFIDATAEPDTLRAGPPGLWGIRTFGDWGAAAGDTLGGLTPNTPVVLRAQGRRAP